MNTRNSITSQDEKLVNMLYGFLLSITKAKEKVSPLSLEKYKKEAKGQVALTEKQTKVWTNNLKWTNNKK